MNLSFVSPIFGTATLRFPALRGAAPRVADPSANSLKPLLSRVVELREYLQGLRDSLKEKTEPLSTTSLKRKAVYVQSGQSIDLSFSGTPSRLTSTEEVNTIPTSFSSFGPSFTGASTSQVTIGGIYDGSLGDETIEFSVKKDGNVGGPFTGIIGTPADLVVEVRWGSGGKLEDIRFDEATSPDTVFTLENGLTVSFAAGTLAKNDSFNLNVSTTVPSRVDPEKPLDGIRNDNPNLEPQFQVTPGTFKLNGILIAVNSGDSIHDILDRMNASGAGVTASFNTATERIELVHNTPGSAGQIQLTEDQTGFLAATKLDGAVLQPGVDTDLQRPIGEVAAFSGISNGNFFINGTEFTVDIATDTLQDILDDINAADLGVSADYLNNRVVLQAASKDQSVNLEDGTSHFFSGSRVIPGIYQPREIGSVSSSLDARGLAGILDQEFEDLAERLKSFFSGATNPAAARELAGIRQALREGIHGAFEDTLGFRESMLRREGPLASELGLTFTLDEKSLHFIHAQEGELSEALEESPDKLLGFLFSQEGFETKDGLFEHLVKSLQKAEQSLTVKTGSSSGLFLDALA